MFIIEFTRHIYNIPVIFLKIYNSKFDSHLLIYKLTKVTWCGTVRTQLRKYSERTY